MLQLLSYEGLRTSSVEGTFILHVQYVITSGSSLKSSTTSKSQQLTPTTQHILLECFDIAVEDEDPVAIPSPDIELEQYLFLNVTFEPDGDVLLFWKRHQCTFPSLASIIKRFTVFLFQIPS